MADWRPEPDSQGRWPAWSRVVEMTVELTPQSVYRSAIGKNRAVFREIHGRWRAGWATDTFQMQIAWTDPVKTHPTFVGVHTTTEECIAAACAKTQMAHWDEHRVQYVEVPVYQYVAFSAFLDPKQPGRVTADVYGFVGHMKTQHRVYYRQNKPARFAVPPQTPEALWLKQALDTLDSDVRKEITQRTGVQV